MATLVGEIGDAEETALSFKPGGPHIQINSISIEIPSGEVNGAMEECNHFSIRGFVREQRKKDISICSPFMSYNKISSSAELPPLDVHKCKWWRCSGCVQDCNSKDEVEKSLVCQGTNKFPQHQETASAGGGSGSSDCQRSAPKGKQLVEEEEGLLTPDVDYSQGGAKDRLNKLGAMGPPKSSSKQRSTTLPTNSNKQNVRRWHKPARTITTPDYAIRSVQQQPDSDAKGGHLRMPQRSIDAQVPPTPPQSDRIQVCNYSSTMGTAVTERGQKLKKPCTEVELEGSGRNNMHVHVRRGPKTRLLSDVIADNVSVKRKADKAVDEQSSKRKNPPFVSPLGSWNKRKRSTVRFAESQDRTNTNLSDQPTFTKNAFHISEVENDSNKTRVSPSVPSPPRHAAGDHCEISFSPIGKDYQPATQLLQFGRENFENSSIPSSTGNDLRVSQVQAGGTLVERKGGEVSSCTQQTRRVKDIDINSIPVDDKAPEADEIPMDIVELLTNLHEHERHTDFNREKSSVQEEVQKPNSSCLLKPQASYSFSVCYANNGVGRPFHPISAEKKIQSDQSNDDPLAFGARFSGGAVNMGPFRPTLRLQPTTPLNTQMWMPDGSISSTSSSVTQFWTYPKYAAAENGRQNTTHQFVFPLKETIPAMQLLNHHHYNNRKKKKTPHFEPYNKPISSTAAACTSQMFVSFDNRTTKRKPVPEAKYAAIATQGEQKCVTNRNPAEMILDSKQVMTFLISPEDLRSRRKPTIPPKPCTVLEGPFKS